MKAECTDQRFRPPHPGEYIREDVLPALGMTVGELANHMGVSRQTLSRLINEKSDVSSEMAIRLGQTFQNGARFWAALQMKRDIWDAEQKFTSKIAPIGTGHAA